MPGRGPFQHHLWVTVVRDVLSRGIDIHTTTRPAISFFFKGLSALQRIFGSTDDPDTALQLVASWIDLLEQAGLETQHYLDVEIERCASLLEAWSRKKAPGLYHVSFIVRELNGRRLPYWTETIDGTCPVRELLTEFPYFKLTESIWFRRCPPFVYKEVHRAWKGPTSAIDFRGIELWPVFPPLRRNDLDHWKSHLVISRRKQMQIEGLGRACDLMESRFERNQMRKLRKAGYRGKRVVNSVMPGTWVD
ncbi:hypothetical protein NM208_g3310 [Fusarium decemcellulare]|uniref:Uncharacterized protein n=1 Tax=Fusarium decemcellulare TaxID=57161 RepID=A0ACC1SPH9_9HYPO|nr:hypothetical protein NM208_g3310 [Fusarium decemcellulare]